MPIKLFLLTFGFSTVLCGGIAPTLRTEPMEITSNKLRIEAVDAGSMSTDLSVPLQQLYTMETTTPEGTARPVVYFGKP